MKKSRENRSEIVGMSIPDDEVPGWIGTLMEEGDFSQEEIDSILGHLNKTYARQKGINKTPDNDPDFIYKALEEQYGHKLTDEERAQVDQDMKAGFIIAAKDLDLDRSDFDR